MDTLQLFVCKNQMLLVRQDALPVLDFSFDTLSWCHWAQPQGDGLAHQFSQRSASLHLGILYGASLKSKKQFLKCISLLNYV